MTCGKPEQPPNSTMVAANYNVDSEVEYRCDPGHVLIGPAQRTCLESGFFDEFPPTCRCESCCFIRGSSLGVVFCETNGNNIELMRVDVVSLCVV